MTDSYEIKGLRSFGVNHCFAKFSLLLRRLCKLFIRNSQVEVLDQG